MTHKEYNKRIRNLRIITKLGIKISNRSIFVGYPFFVREDFVPIMDIGFRNIKKLSESNKIIEFYYNLITERRLKSNKHSEHGNYIVLYISPMFNPLSTSYPHPKDKKIFIILDKNKVNKPEHKNIEGQPTKVNNANTYTYKVYL